MSRSHLIAGMALAAALAAISLPGARAEETDPADIAFWQSIQGSTNSAEYKAYLEAFPNGRFAAIARLRSAQGAALPAAPAAQPPLATAAVEAAAGPSEKILVAPVSRVGQAVTFTCQNFPEPSSFDQLVVVPAGTPDIDPGRARDETKIVWMDFAQRCAAAPVKGGPFAPGAYEVRYVTRLYNNDGRLEVHARSPFSVR